MLNTVSANDDGIAQALNKLDIHYLRTASDQSEIIFEDSAELVFSMAQHQQMRIREALIPLFLRHPDLAKLVPDLIKKLSADSAFALSHLYTAAVYLQSLWRGQLEQYLPELKQLPNYFGLSQWGLPDTSVHYGEAGLRLLAQKVYDHNGENWLDVYTSSFDLFLDQLQLKHD